MWCHHGDRAPGWRGCRGGLRCLRLRRDRAGFPPAWSREEARRAARRALARTQRSPPSRPPQNGNTALAIARRLGYISVVDTLKVVTEEVTTTTTVSAGRGPGPGRRFSGRVLFRRHVWAHGSELLSATVSWARVEVPGREALTAARAVASSSRARSTGNA